MRYGIWECGGGCANKYPVGRSWGPPLTTDQKTAALAAVIDFLASGFERKVRSVLAARSR